MDKGKLRNSQEILPITISADEPLKVSKLRLKINGKEVLQLDNVPQVIYDEQGLIALAINKLNGMPIHNVNIACNADGEYTLSAVVSGDDERQFDRILFCAKLIVMLKKLHSTYGRVFEDAAIEAGFTKRELDDLINERIKL